MCSRKQIDLLFQKNSSANSFPLKAVFIETEVDLVFPVQAMFVVPKRNFKKAHDRNKLKRRMREAYRLHKHSFYESLKANDKKMNIAFIYTAKKQEDYLVIEASVTRLMGQALKSVKAA